MSGEGRATPSPLRGDLAAFVGVAALSALASAWWLHGGTLNYDSAYALAWGSQIAHGSLPDYAVAQPPTPHPLTLAMGVLASLAGRGAPAVAGALGFAAVGALAGVAFLLARRLGGTAAGLLVVVLVLTRDRIAFYGGLGYPDIAFAALVLGAAHLGLRERPAPARVLALLLLAGLLRPEAWVLSAVYAAHLGVRRSDLTPGRIALAAGAPVLWLAGDLLLTGDPLYSFTLTSTMTQALERPTGLGALPGLPRSLGQSVRPAVAAGAVLGVAVLVVRRDGVGLRLVVVGVAATAATALTVAAGTPLNDRYLFVGVVLACVLCAVAVGGVATGGRPARAVGALALALLVVGATSDAARLDGSQRAVLAERRVQQDAVRAVGAAAPACAPLHVSARLVPAVSVATGVRPHDLVSRSAPVLDRRGSWLVPTRDPSARAAVALGPREPDPPRGARPVAWTHSWTLRATCG